MTAVAVRGDKPAARFKPYPALNHVFMPGTEPSSGAEYLKPNHVSEEVIGDMADWIANEGKDEMYDRILQGMNAFFFKEMALVAKITL